MQTIWPGSHEIMSAGFRSQSNWDPSDDYRRLLEQVKSSITPLELCGQPGDM